MQIQVQAPRIHDAQAFRDAALARARFMLRRAAQEVLQARILLRDVNGPRGGIDQQCRVMLVTRSRGVLVVTSRAHDAGKALANALHMAVRALVKVWQRKRQPERKGLRTAATASQGGIGPENALDPQHGLRDLGAERP